MVFDIGNYYVKIEFGLMAILLLITIILLVLEFFYYDKMNSLYYSKGMIAEIKKYKYENRDDVVNNAEKLRNKEEYSVKINKNVIILKINSTVNGFRNNHGLIPLTRIDVTLDDNEKIAIISMRLMYSAIIVPVYQVFMSLYSFRQMWGHNTIDRNITTLFVELIFCYFFIFRVLRGQKIEADHIASILKLPGTILLFNNVKY